MMKIKRLTAPKTWPIMRKTAKWIIGSKGAKIELSLPITVIMRDLIGVCDNKKEVKKLLNLRRIKINGKPISEVTFGVNLFDVIAVEGLKHAHRLVINEKGDLAVIEIPEKESDSKLVKVTGKHIVKGGKLQLHFHDGRTMLSEDASINVGDSLLLKFPELSVESHLKLDKGMIVFITGGSHMGETAKIVDFHEFKGPQQDRVVLSVGKNKFETLEEYGFVVGTEKPIIVIK